MPKALTTSEVNFLRSTAKKYSRSQGIPYSRSLDRVANDLGYKNWALLHKHSIPDPPKQTTEQPSDDGAVMETSAMSKIPKSKQQVLDLYESRNDAWTYRDFESDLEKLMGSRYGNYLTARLAIIEADRIGRWPKTVERYVRTNFASFGNLPIELNPIGQRFDLGLIA